MPESPHLSIPVSFPSMRMGCGDTHGKREAPGLPPEPEIVPPVPADPPVPDAVLPPDPPALPVTIGPSPLEAQLGNETPSAAASVAHNASSERNEVFRMSGYRA